MDRIPTLRVEYNNEWLCGHCQLCQMSVTDPFSSINVVIKCMNINQLCLYLWGDVLSGSHEILFRCFCGLFRSRLAPMMRLPGGCLSVLVMLATITLLNVGENHPLSSPNTHTQTHTHPHRVREIKGYRDKSERGGGGRLSHFCLWDYVDKIASLCTFGKCLGGLSGQPRVCRPRGSLLQEQALPPKD